MTNYYDHPAMSQSKLKDFKRSPAHFYARHLDPSREAQIETDAMKFGGLVHTCILEPASFSKRYYTMPNIDRRTKEGKETYEATILAHKGKILVTMEQVLDAQAMRMVIANKPAAKLILAKKGLIEKEFYFVDEETKIECKLKPDYFIEPCTEFPNGLILDLKTTFDARLSEFAKSIFNFGYYLQVGWYCKGLKQIYNTESYAPFLFIPIEKSKPFECSFFLADETILNAGLKESAKLLSLYKSCLISGNWPGYNSQIETIGMSSWSLKLLEGG